MTLKLLCQLSSTIPLLQGTEWRPCVSLLNGECGSDKGQIRVVIHIIHSKLQFPSEVSLAYCDMTAESWKVGPGADVHC
jgi:hypothetical protein